MGTQQILLIVLSVIIVGIAVAVGITMFNQQAENSNRNACLADLNMFVAAAKAYFRTPASHGGAGNGTAVMLDMCNWIGFNFEVAGDGTGGTTGNGEYTMTLNGNVLSIAAAGNEGTDPKTRIDLDTDVITTVLSGDLPST